MENWLILNKLIILIYISTKMIEDGLNSPKNTLEVIFFILMFISLNMSKAIIQNRKYKYIILLISILELYLCYLFINPMFVLWIPINIYEIFLDKFKWKYILAVLIISIFFVKETILTEYVAISLLSLVAFYFILEYERRIKSLTIYCDELKEKNHKLFTNLNSQVEYKKQIIYTSQLEERNKIAQEIHDKLGHSISGSLMQLEAAKLVMDKDVSQSRSLIENTIKVLREGMDSIRVTLKNIKPETEQIGVNKIKLLLDELKNNSKITGGIYYSGNLNKITFLQWKVIYENVKEALTNVIKYSNAKEVKVDINVLNKFIKIEIKDNGNGCNKIIKGLGLSGIEERTLNLNGKTIIDGSDGFSVIFLLPINET